jgi:hypothetical protein
MASEAIVIPSGTATVLRIGVLRLAGRHRVVRVGAFRLQQVTTYSIWPGAQVRAPVLGANLGESHLRKRADNPLSNFNFALAPSILNMDRVP